MKSFRYFYILAVISSLAFFSCSDSETDVVTVTASTIFDYSDNENPPSARLAVFFQVTNEVQRTDSFVVSNEKSGYSWNVKNPGIFTGLNKNYTYSLNLSAPEGESIPVGSYSAVYYDAAGNEDSINFDVNYSLELLKSNALKCKDFLGKYNENIAVYDDSGELLFMGKAKASWKSNESILKDYKTAFSKRICYVTSGNSIICMMPEEKLLTDR
ncbi:hypothetical protein [Treponema sp.]|uniref:hypothetical protein n=1 Tax=Treponema sp. TaxID=166 RepID=UPI00388D28B4